MEILPPLGEAILTSDQNTQKWRPRGKGDTKCLRSLKPHHAQPAGQWENHDPILVPSSKLIPREKKNKNEGLLDVEAALELLPLLGFLLQAAQTF